MKKAIVFSMLYLVAVISLVGNWQRPALFDDIPDLIIFVIALGIFFKARNLHRTAAQKYLMVGALVVASQRLLRIPIQELDFVGVSLPYLWIAVWILYFVGVFLIMMGFKRYD